MLKKHDYSKAMKLLQEGNILEYYSYGDNDSISIISTTGEHLMSVCSWIYEKVRKKCYEVDRSYNCVHKKLKEKYKTEVIIKTKRKVNYTFMTGGGA